LNKEEPFIWEQEQEEFFIMLIEIQQESCFLIHADPKDPFYLNMIGSDVGMEMYFCKEETDI